MIVLRVNRSENAKNRSIYCITFVCMCAKAESCLCSIYVYVIYELQRVCKDVAIILCMCKLQRVDDRVIITLSIKNLLYTLHATYIEHDLYANFSLRLERLLKEFSCDRFTVQDEQDLSLLRF